MFTGPRGRTELTTTTADRASASKPCCSSQSRVRLADRAPSTLGALTTTIWSARWSTASMTVCSTPGPQSVRISE